MHPLVRDHAVETSRELDRNRAMAASARAISTTSCSLVETARVPSDVGGGQGLRDLLETDAANVESALEWALDTHQAERALPLATPACSPHQACYSPSPRTVAPARPDARPTVGCLIAARDPSRAKVLRVAGRCAADGPDIDTAREWFGEALTLDEHLGDDRSVASSLRGLGYVQLLSGEPGSALVPPAQPEHLPKDRRRTRYRVVHLRPRRGRLRGRGSRPRPRAPRGGVDEVRAARHPRRPGPQSPPVGRRCAAAAPSGSTPSPTSLASSALQEESRDVALEECCWTAWPGLPQPCAAPRQPRRCSAPETPGASCTAFIASRGSSRPTTATWLAPGVSSVQRISQLPTARAVTWRRRRRTRQLRQAVADLVSGLSERPASLTFREVQVLDLVADGLSNARDRRAARHQSAHGPRPPAVDLQQARRDDSYGCRTRSRPAEPRTDRSRMPSSVADMHGRPGQLPGYESNFVGREREIADLLAPALRPPTGEHLRRRGVRQDPAGPRDGTTAP